MKRSACLAAVAGLMVLCSTGCLSYSHYKYCQRAEAARDLKDGVTAKPGRIYFVSFPENELALSILGWHPTIGHAALVTRDQAELVKQYDYGWFCGYGGQRPRDAIGYVDKSESYGVVRRKVLQEASSAKTTSDLEIAKMVLNDLGVSSKTKKGLYGDKVEIWAKDVADIGIAERYMEQLADDENRGSMLWRFWQIGGYRCGNITRQSFDAARGEGHFLDLLWGGFPGADAPSIGTEKTVFQRTRE